MKYADINLKGSKNTKEPIHSNSSNKGGLLIFLILFSCVAIATFIFRNSIKKYFNPISVVASVTSTKLKETDGRTNILLLGVDKRSEGTVTSVLTDTILIASIGRVDNDIVLISVPRDLWIQTYHSKINAIYTMSENNQKGTGTEELKKSLEGVLGIPIHYYALVTFDLFEQTIDTVGGVNISVDNAFTDYYYPVEGKEDSVCGKTGKDLELAISQQDPLVGFPCRYETINFTVGQHLMDGKTALKFVRSRHGNNGEDTDFARSKRQQKVIAALKDKAFSLQTILDINKLKGLYDTYSNNVVTDVDFGTIQTFYLLSKQVDLSKVVSVVLDDRSDANDGGLLYHPEDATLYGGQYVLVPQTGDYSQIHAFVQKYLFGK